MHLWVKMFSLHLRIRFGLRYAFMGQNENVVCWYGVANSGFGLWVEMFSLNISTWCE